MSKRILTLAITLTAALTAPSLASAHTGSVSCQPNGSNNSNLTFTYQANFAHDTTVTENVNGVTKTILVHAHTATTDTIPAPAASVIAGATWSDGNTPGSIPFVALACTYTPPPITVDVCIPTQTVTRTVYTPGPATVAYIDVPGATTYVTKWRTKVVYRIKWRTKIRLIPYTPVHQPKTPIHKQPGVTG